MKKKITKIQRQLVKEMYRILKSKDSGRIRSKHMLCRLNSDPQKRWATFCDGNPLNYWRLYELLKDFDIKSKNIRFGKKVKKGFLIEDFHKAMKLIKKLKKMART